MAADRNDLEVVKHADIVFESGISRSSLRKLARKSGVKRMGVNSGVYNAIAQVVYTLTEHLLTRKDKPKKVKKEDKTFIAFEPFKRFVDNMCEKLGKDKLKKPQLELLQTRLESQVGAVLYWSNMLTISGKRITLYYKDVMYAHDMITQVCF